MLMNLDPLSSSGIDDGEPGGTTWRGLQERSNIEKISFFES